MFKAMALICSAWIANGEAEASMLSTCLNGSLRQKKNVK